MFFLIAFILFIASCDKYTPSDSGSNGNGNGNNASDTVAVDPAVANTIGFFLNDWQAKSFTVPSYTDTTIPTANPTVTVSVDASKIITKIPTTVFGQNANSWMTQIVSENTLMNHLKNLQPGIIRFPGGSISDVYFWNQTSAAPSDAPATLLDANGNAISNPYWYGKRNDSWTISVDNYYQLLQQSGSTGIITVNYGYARYGMSAGPVAAAAHLAADWVRYDNGRTKYWEIGNECNGVWEAGYRMDTAANQDGQPEIITGALYGQHFKVFADSMKKAAQEIGKTIYIGAYIFRGATSIMANTDRSNMEYGCIQPGKIIGRFSILFIAITRLTRKTRMLVLF